MFIVVLILSGCNSASCNYSHTTNLYLADGQTRLSKGVAPRSLRHILMVHAKFSVRASVSTITGRHFQTRVPILVIGGA